MHRAVDLVSLEVDRARKAGPVYISACGGGYALQYVILEVPTIGDGRIGILPTASRDVR